MPQKASKVLFLCFSVLDLGVRHQLLGHQLQSDVAEHHVKMRAHSPTGPADEANLPPAICLHQELHKDGINGMDCPRANHIVQPSMFFNKALRR